jgi:hypothetical protein
VEQEPGGEAGASTKYGAEVELQSSAPPDIRRHLHPTTPKPGVSGTPAGCPHAVRYDFSILKKSPEVALTATFSLALSRLSP